jgi:hypothetical protein
MIKLATDLLLIFLLSCIAADVSAWLMAKWLQEIREIGQPLIKK